MSDLLPHLEALAGHACMEGGWGYGPGQPAHLEPTCLALLALAPHRDRHQALIDQGLGWLQGCAGADGIYRLGRGRREAVWATALALFTRLVLVGAEEGQRQTVAGLLGVRGRPDEAGKDDEDFNDVDGALIGWPWAEQNFSWVEPTSWACLALRRAGQADHPRVGEGLKLLLDRTLEEGGLNYGNRRIFGISLEPIPGPTALALLALQGSTDPRVLRSVEYLSQQALTNDDLEHLCWIRLALDAYRQLPEVAGRIEALRKRITAAVAARAATPYVKPACVREALTCLALAVEEGNPFRLPAGTPAGPAVEPVVPPAPRSMVADWVRSKVQAFGVAALTGLRTPGAETNVHIAPVGGYNENVADVIRRQYEHFRQAVPLASKRVVLKPNLVEYHRDKVINTHPHVVAAVIELCQREGAREVLVAEGPGHWRNVEYLVGASGLGDVLRTYGVPFVDLNHDEPVKRPNLGRLTRLDHLFLAQTIASADVVISLPKLKTHHWAVATLSLKNLFGTLPGICYGWPKNELHWRGIDNSIVDIALTRTPDLAIVDGVVGMEGDGPLNGTPRATGVVVMGSDLVAVDATCCRLMQLDPARVGYLELARRRRLGLLAEGQIKQLGETIQERAQPFDTVAHFRPLWVGRGA